MCPQVNLRTEHRRKLFLFAFAFLAQVVLLSEVIPQRVVVTIEVIGSIGVAKVAKEVLLPQMPKQLVLVQEALVAVLAQRMAPVTDVVRIAHPPMDGQVLAGVAPPFGREDLQMLGTDVAVEQLVPLADVLPQDVELGEVLLVASGTLVVQQLEERLLHVSVRKADPILFVVQPGPILHVQLLVRGERLGEDDLGQIAATDRTVILPAQHPNPGRALEAAQVVTLADGVELDRLEANHANPVAVRLRRFRRRRAFDGGTSAAAVEGTSCTAAAVVAIIMLLMVVAMAIVVVSATASSSSAATMLAMMALVIAGHGSLNDGGSSVSSSWFAAFFSEKRFRPKTRHRAFTH